MKNIILLIAFLTVIMTQAQEKVKGNREPSTVITDIEVFNTIEIGGDYEVAIVKGSTAQIEITTDSNLHAFIVPTVTNGLLTINTTARIRSKKELKIRLIYPGNLGTIVVKEKAELSTITEYESDELSIETRGDAKIFITAKVEKLTLIMKGSSNGEINFKGENATLKLEDNANLKALLDYNSATITMFGKSDARVDGDMKTATVTLENRAEFDGSNLVIDDLNVVISNNANAKVNAKSNLNLKSRNDVKIELYGTPKIVLAEFTGSSVLSKK
jgi:hypothetical protein